MLRQFRRIRELREYAIGATDGDIGRLEGLYCDESSWAVRYLIVNTGSWLMGRRLLIAPMAISNLDEASGALHLGLTRDQVEGSPPVDTE